MDKFKTLITQIRNLFEWLIPFNIFLMLIFIIKLFFKDINLNELLKIIIWPVTVLLILFFFRKVVTFLFFSMNEFNFFGAKGNLKDVNEIILEEVEKRFIEEKKEQKVKDERNKLYAEIHSRENEINKAKGTAKNSLKFAKEIIIEWKKSVEKSNYSINDLTQENKRLREIVSSVSTSPSVSPTIVKSPEMGSGEKTTDLKPGVPIIK